MNFLLIGVDQMRFDTAGAYGNPLCKTPYLDGLAANGTLFENAYTTCPLCTPARSSMFTGQYAFTHRMATNCDMYQPMCFDLEHPEDLLHYAMLDAGLRCGYLGKWHVGCQKGPVDYGFQGMNVAGYGDFTQSPDFVAYLKKHNLSFAIKDPIYFNANQKTLGAGIWDGPEESTPEYYLASRAIEMLEHYSAHNDPFFLTCQFWGPHMPHLPPASFAGLHDRTLIEKWPNFDDDFSGKACIIRREQRDFYRRLPESWGGWQEFIGLYYDFVSFIDQQIGRILQALERLGLGRDTLVVFTSDHGDMQGSHGQSLDKGFLYQEAVRIPLIMWLPGQSAPARSPALAYNMDILPTMLDCAGIPIPSKAAARSLRPVLLGEAESCRESLYLEFHGLRFLYSQRALVTKEGYKYIFSAGDFDEVYDLNRDPAELHNLIDDPARASLVESLRQGLMDMSAAAQDPLADYIHKIFGHWESPAARNWLPQA